MSETTPSYSIWQAVRAAINLSLRAIEEVRALSRLPGPEGQQGEPGRDGRDGFNLEDLDVLFDGDRTVTLRFSRGDLVKEWPLVFAHPLDRGVYRPDTDYQRGDSVTFGGSSWIAQTDTRARPETNSDWRLAVKRGRDGKEGKDGERGLQGKEGPPGRDLTQMTFDGKKY